MSMQFVVGGRLRVSTLGFRVRLCELGRGMEWRDLRNT
jgi:hypothetical protein